MMSGLTQVAHQAGNAATATSRSPNPPFEVHAPPAYPTTIGRFRILIADRFPGAFLPQLVRDTADRP